MKHYSNVPRIVRKIKSGFPNCQLLHVIKKVSKITHTHPRF